MKVMPIVVGILAFASMLDANAADPLPGSMSGRYSGVGSRGGSVKFEVSVVIEKQDPDGTVEGKLTRFGYRCGAKGEPFKGTWDGAQFRFTSMGRANVNTAQGGGDCGDNEYVMKRSADGKSFEGTFGNVGSPEFRIVLKP